MSITFAIVAACISLIGGVLIGMLLAHMSR